MLGLRFEFDIRWDLVGIVNLGVFFSLGVVLCGLWSLVFWF